MHRSLLRRGAWLLACFLVCTGCATRPYHDAYLVLDDLAAAGDSRLERSTAEPSRTPISYTIDGRSNRGDLYLPGEGAPEAGVVLVPGAVPEGKDHERLVALALTLARVRFAVLTPELSGYRELRIRPDQVREWLMPSAISRIARTCSGWPSGHWRLQPRGGSGRARRPRGRHPRPRALRLRRWRLSRPAARDPFLHDRLLRERRQAPACGALGLRSPRIRKDGAASPP